MKGMYVWLGKHVHAPYGIVILGLLTIIEGFFIIPVSTVLAFSVLKTEKKHLSMLPLLLSPLVLEPLLAIIWVFSSGNGQALLL